MNRIYTRTGDRGETGLFGGGRVEKDHPRVEAYGAVDELNAVIGSALVGSSDEQVSEILSTVQRDLFALGARLATPEPQPGRKQPALPPLPRDRISAMEGWIDGAEEELPPLRAFILPGGSAAGAALHLARTVCRRAERRVVKLAGEEDVDDDVVVYLNRLSDLLFMLARLVNHRAGAEEVEWHPEE